SKFGSEIGEFIHSCTIFERETFIDDLTNRYKYELKIDSSIIERVSLFKRIAVELVFQSPQLHQMEFKGDYMLRKIFKVLEDNYITEVKNIRLLPDFTDRLIRHEDNQLLRSRLVCDYIAGMTDAFAMTTYRRLFDPDYGSIADIF
ncbi:MAG: deoxyguanosinetriphosphate triphosphohydrolase, partial [Melioribacteraceae bacterium]|nr:deoxyguanosinetriphosphate triphosphohydrolase [Melioribacteraceae bacterium]